MNKILDYNDYVNIEKYCSTQCKNILLNVNDNSLYYQKGRYKSFLYCKKLNTHLKSNKKYMKQYEFYNLIKIQKNNVINIYHPKKDYINGMVSALYEIMNLMSCLNQNSNQN